MAMWLYLEYGYKWLVVCDYTYLPGKVIMMELLKAIQCIQCFSLSAVPMRLLLANGMGLRMLLSGDSSNLTAQVVSGLK